MQSAKKAFWNDILVYKSTDVPWKIKCQRLVGHVYTVLRLEVKTGRGPCRRWKRSKDGKPRQTQDGGEDQ